MRFSPFFPLGLFMLCALSFSGLYLKADWGRYQFEKARWQQAMQTKKDVSRHRIKKITTALSVPESIAFITHHFNESHLTVNRLTVMGNSFYRCEVSGDFSAWMNWLQFASGSIELARYEIKCTGDHLTLVMILRPVTLNSADNLKDTVWQDPFHLQMTVNLSSPLKQFSIHDMHWVGMDGANFIWQLPNGALLTIAPYAVFGQEACQGHLVAGKELQLTCEALQNTLVRRIT